MKIADARLSGKQRLEFISNLATMLSAGIPIIQAVESLVQDSKGGQRIIILQLLKDLNDGHTVSSSLARAPHAFDAVTVNLIRAAEEAGTLDDTLKDLVKTIKKDMEFSNNIKGSLAYPAFIVAVFGGVLLLILGFVIPRIAKVFISLHVPLPWTTQALIWASNTLLAFYPYLIVAAFFLTFGAIALYQVKRRALIAAALTLPVLNNLGRQIDLARMTRSMGLLLNSGIPITDVLDLVKNVVNKPDIVRIVEQTKAAVSSGKPLSAGLKSIPGVIPPMMLRIVDASEASGTLEGAMQELSEYFDTQVTNSLKTLTTLLEPILLVIIGLLVGGMMLSIIAPIYNLIGQVHAR